jgi:hypothetical protein
VHQHQVGDAAQLVGDRVHADVHRAALDDKQRLRACGDLARAGAVQAVRERRGPTQQSAFARAQPDREQALVLHRAVEQRLQARPALVAQALGHRIGKRVGHQRPAQRQVAREPAHRQAVHQRQRQVCGDQQRDQQRQQEAQLQPVRTHADTQTPVHSRRSEGLGV